MFRAVTWISRGRSWTTHRKSLGPRTKKTIITELAATNGRTSMSTRATNQPFRYQYQTNNNCYFQSSPSFSLAIISIFAKKPVNGIDACYAAYAENNYSTGNTAR